MGERRGVGAAFAACGVDVALDGVVRLVAGLVQRAQVHPGSGVAVVQLHGADVRLQCVHGLVLLLVQHPEERDRGQDREGRTTTERGEKLGRRCRGKMVLNIFLLEINTGNETLPDRAPGICIGL